MNPRNPIILCVDDEEANLKLLEKILVPRGYVIVSAASGKDALLKINSQAIDLVLLDVLMPQMDGFEVCRQIKQDQKLRNIPVIMITALTAKQDRIRGIEAGAEEFLSKPLDQTEVLARIKLLLKVKELNYDALQIANEKLQAEIVERKLANEQLRNLAAYNVSAREEERTRIAREIHDGIGTLMTAIKMDMVFLVRGIGEDGAQQSPDALREQIGATTKLVDEAIQSLHEIVSELRPGVLDHLGLRAALEWQMQEFQERTKIECLFTSDLDELEPDPSRATAVFRILQEVLTNVARHAQATRVETSLRRQATELILQVRDNGKGISETQTSSAGRFGLLGIRERVQVFGGSVVIRGAPGEGTDVTVRIPV
jgi:signal transduction histidine kinase